MNIVLIGYRGTGKTAIAERLGSRLSMKVVGMDEEIVKRTGKSIPEIVQEHGWDHFRDIESRVAAELENEDGLIIDAGGGIVVRPQNIAVLKKNGMIFWLVADEETIVSRIVTDHQRPSLSGTKSFTEEVAEVLAQRRPLYEAAADHIIDTAKLPLAESVELIANIFLSHKSGK
ncbi:MAG: shikimate kinase [Candidatus Abyssobacteria bacterium SURF_5]|uniref:Shikimate kinase n=1 Tax=Abyssobacteria bacterium (strain SURF_5) TaxID=2093360 RepID=A0A3A4N5A8_ABYX5|nr:MAG: shikimate kinase [Candidatus Abyssubacteria bacterium SURF_5]